MKTDSPTRQPHRQHINGLVNKRPAEWAEEKLQSVRDYGDGQCDDDAGARQWRRAEQAIWFVRQFHRQEINHKDTKDTNFG